ncbi:MAG: T9SS type A sorting domain-containing protein [Bacteroidetes bacterium]|nr:T9SS type A sorting domain-containing protein [Bacteroidota bacterium]
MPNPADNFEIVFTVAQAGNAIIQITTITGSVILSENVEVIEGEQTRNYTTENMPSGMYFSKYVCRRCGNCT